MGIVNYKLYISGDWDAADTGGVTFTNGVVHQPYQLGNGTTDTSLSLGGITTASLVYIKSDQNISVKLNSASNTALTVSADKPFLATGTSVTAVYVSNASGSSANIEAFLAGA